MTKKIYSILVTMVAPMSNHAANRGEKILGNASSVKRRPDGRVYISGQMQRHVLFSAIDRLNEMDNNKGDTYVSNGDGITTKIEKDLRGDLGGYLDTNKGEYSGRRSSPVSATPAVALGNSAVGRDLLVRLRLNHGEKGGADAKKQALATNEFSEHDDMFMSFHLDVGQVGVRKGFKYEDTYHVGTYFESFIDDNEHARRVRLFLEGTRYMNDFANQARNAVSGEPEKVLIVLDDKHSRKAARYFHYDTTDEQRKAMLQELEDRGVAYFLGDDTTAGSKRVSQAYSEALEKINEMELYRPANMQPPQDAS